MKFKKLLYYDSKTLGSSHHDFTTLQMAIEEAYVALTELYLEAIFPFLNAVFLLFLQNNTSTLSTISAEYL